MPLDPQCAALIAAAAQQPPPFNISDPAVARAAYLAATSGYAYVPGPIDCLNAEFPGSTQAIKIRIYRPQQSPRPLPTLCYFHGGGWALGDLDSHDHLCRHLAFRAQICVVAVDYRLAPEHLFPAAIDDSVTAVEWVVRNANLLNIDPVRLAVGGDSAGGQLAASTALILRDKGTSPLRFQLLIYPVCDYLAENDSLKVNATGYLLTRAAYQKFCDWYVPDHTRWSDPQVSPQHATNHANLPPALIQTAEFDPLRDEGRDYADTLRAAGNIVEYKCYPGMVHGFARMAAKIDLAKTALDDAARALRAALCD